MANLVSPGVSVTVTDESFFIPAAASTVPLFFLATSSEKLQPNGTSPAAGTYEHDEVRTITSLAQSVSLYGVPTFMEDFNGNQHHGDARNEYGLFAMNQFLGVGNRAFVVRANVNLNDDRDSVLQLWNEKIQQNTNPVGAAYVLEGLINDYLNTHNATEGLIPSSPSSGGTQTVQFSPSITGATSTDLTAATYDFAVTTGTTLQAVSITTLGTETFNDLVILINAQLTTAVVSIVSGNLKFVNPNIGHAGSISVTDGAILPLFAELNLVGRVNAIDSAIPGTEGYKTTVTQSELLTQIELAMEQVLGVQIIGINKYWEESTFSKTRPDFLGNHTPGLNVFANGYSVAPSGPNAFLGIEGQAIIDNGGGTIVGEWSAEEARLFLIDMADDFQYTVEFLNQTSLGANDAARRVAIAEALAATINSNTEVRSEALEYNLILCPGYPEVMDELVALVVDINEEAFIVADTPMNMTPEQVVKWGDTPVLPWPRQSSSNMAYYYPHGLASNLDGKNVMVAASGIALRTITFSDNVSELWFAPAGTRRGQVTGVAAMGYVTGTLGLPTTFTPINLNLGQRDDLYKYNTNINPITYIPGRGILVFGQKTSAPDASALDRINVSRLIKYIKRQLRKNTLSFLFEPNDQLTRDNLKAVVDSFLSDIVVKRGLYDYATVCDASNNTPDRIDRNELYIDIALKPVKAVEFLYIPIRILSTGAQI